MNEIKQVINNNADELEQAQKDIQTNTESIAELKEKDTTQDSLIEELQTKVVNLEAEKVTLGKLDNKLLYDLYKTVKSDDVNWENVTIYNGGGDGTYAATAITSDYVYMPKGTVIYFYNTDVYRSRVTLYDLNKKYIKNTGTYINRTNYTLEDSCYVRIGLNKTGITVDEGNSTNVLFEGYTLNDTTKELENRTMDYDITIKNINHRGYSATAPENTLSAYKLSKQNGFKYVECDVSFTSDGVAVLLHDTTIDRTSNGTGSIKDLTFEELRTLDFGSWKSITYEGELIPSFEEFISLCKKIGLYPYIELKTNDSYSTEQIYGLIDIVRRYGMLDKVTWISFSSSYLNTIKEYYNKARLGYIVN